MPYGEKRSFATISGFAFILVAIFLVVEKQSPAAIAILCALGIFSIAIFKKARVEVAQLMEIIDLRIINPVSVIS